MPQNRLQILTQAEIKSLYACPRFSDNERQYYFALNDAEIQIMKSLGSVNSRIYFITQLGYFKATSLFFPHDFLSHQEDLSFITNDLFSKTTTKPILLPSNKTRKKIHNHILELTGFTATKETIHQSIQSMLSNKVTINTNPIYLFYEILLFLQENKMRLLGYTTLQNLISETLITEERRLRDTLSKAIPPLINQQLDELLLAKDGLYALTALKKDPKNFRTKHIKIEVRKLENSKNIYQFATNLLPTLKLSKQSLNYYAFLAQHYSIDRLKKIPQALAQLYLLCYVYVRYQQINDNLVTCFMHLINKYYDNAKASAKDIIFNKIIPVSSDSKQAAKALAFYIDSDIEDDTHFGTLRKAAFKLLDKDKFPNVIQFIAGVLFDAEKTCWDELAHLKATITTNIRPIFNTLDFGCSDSPLLEGIQFLKDRFLNNNTSTDMPLDCITSKKQSYLKENNDDDQGGSTDIDIHRYEFMIYYLMKKQFESGNTFVNDSISYKKFTRYLVDDERWKHKEQLLKELGCDNLLIPINDIMSQHEAILEPLIKAVNQRIECGDNKGISIKKKGDEISWTLPYQKQEEKANNPVFSTLPRISIADVLRFADKDHHFMQAFTHIKPHGAKSEQDSVAIIACLIANGTNLGVYKMAENSNLDYNRMLRQSKNFIYPETLRKANDILSNAIAELPIFSHWDIHEERLYGSVDGQKFGTRLHTFMARYSSKYFGVGKGVVAYTLLANHVPINAKIISANQHESHFLFDILRNNTCHIDPTWISGDSHAINNVNFLLLDLIDKQFSPHFKKIQIKSQTLYGFNTLDDYKDYLIKPTHQVDKQLIEVEWDNMLRIIVSLLLGETSQHIIVSKLSSYKHKNTTKLALWELDKILMSQYLLRYIDDPMIRRGVRISQNRSEAFNQLRRALANVNGQKFRGSDPLEISIWNECARLLSNCIIYYNAKILSELLTKFEENSDTESIKKLAHISPVAWTHISLGGFYEFDDGQLEIDLKGMVNSIYMQQAA